MKLDNETQQKFILEMFNQVTFPGNLLDMAYEVKVAVRDATVGPTTPDEVTPTNPRDNFDLTRG